LLEELIHFIWKFRLFDVQSLYTTEGDKLRIEEVGQYNRDAGPDFEFAKIHINDTLWSGQVEIHVNEEDWLRHQHQCDKRYDSTILHVVWESSPLGRIQRTDNTFIPTLVLKGLVDPAMLLRYAELMNNLQVIPCEHRLSEVSALTVLNCLCRMSVGRLEEKGDVVLKRLAYTNNDWERVLLITLGRSFGMKVNAFAFEELCLRLDLGLIHKYHYDNFKIESMLFGQAGFLHTTEDDYSKSLQAEYQYLSHLHGLISIEREFWRFMRMRPYNFPTYRLGQLAALLSNRSYWFAYVQEVEDLQTIFDTIDKSVMNTYWCNHYRFGASSAKHSISWSLSFKIHLAVNCFIPVLFAYGMYIKEDRYKEKAINWLSALPTERNHITEKFKNYSVICENAADSQGLLHLYNAYCTQKKCLSCAIGLAILKN